MTHLSPIEQAKRNVLKILESAGPEIKEIIFPCLQRDKADYTAALALKDVKKRFNDRGITPKLVVIDQGADIVIATIDDVASGKLDHLFPKF